MKRLLAISCFAFSLAASQAAYATTITLTVGAGGNAGDYILGEVIPAYKGLPGLAARDEFMIDTLRVMSLGERTPASGDSPEWYRSTTNFGVLPDAVQAGAVLAQGTGEMTIIGDKVVITLPSDMTYKYLVGAWDGNNSGAEVWYIGDIDAGTKIEIPLNVDKRRTPDLNLFESTKHRITTYTLFNPTASDPDGGTTSARVPDGGTTAALLGLAMLGLGIGRRLKG